MQEPIAIEAPPERARTFAALGVRDFRVLWAGTWASYLPFFMANVVNGVVAFHLAHVNRAVGTVVFAQGVAMAALAPLGGAGADRWPKRRVLALSQSAAAAVFGTLALLLALDRLSIAALAGGAFVLGVAISFLGPARQAFAAELVGPDLRGNAVALNQVPLTGSQVLGPAIAGLMLASPFGATGAYALMSALYATSALSLVALPKSLARTDAAETHVLADLGDGLRYVGSHRRLRLLVGFFVCVIMMGFSYVTVLPGLVEHALGRPADEVPPLFFTSALGGLTITLITARLADSRRAVPGTLFACMPGTRADGADFAPDAVKRGASAVLSQRRLPGQLGATQVVVRDVRTALAEIAAACYGRPSESLKVVGVTGTNGKTTTVHLVRAILEAAGEKVGVMGTLGHWLGGQYTKDTFTTPEAPDVQRYLRAMLDCGASLCAMEVSSHAIALRRVDQVSFDVVAFTNLTRDHLDFH